jgi:hypothetical protein
VSAQLPPAVEAAVRAAVDGGVDALLSIVPLELRRYVEGSPVWGTVRQSLGICLEVWALRLVADIIAPPVRVTADDDAVVTVRVE